MTAEDDDPEEIEDADVAPIEEVSPKPVEDVHPEDVQDFHEPTPEQTPRSAEEIPQARGPEAEELIDEIDVSHPGSAPGGEDPATGEALAVRRPPHGGELIDDLEIAPTEAITELPEIDAEGIDVREVRTIREDLTFVRILLAEDTSRYHYEVVEPTLDEHEEEILDFVRETLVQTLDPRDPGGRAREHLQDAIEEVIVEHGIELDDVSRARVHYYLERDFIGYGPIDVMMQDPMIEDISCDGPGIPVYVFHREIESTRSNVVFPDEGDLDGYVRRLAQRSGRHISIAEPMLDATLPDTSRLQATLSREVTTRGSSFTIRRFQADPLTMPDLVRLGTVSSRMAAWFWLAMEAGSPILYAGGTASGKTTTMAAASLFIPPSRKIVTIEDTREIRLMHENWIASLTRGGASEDDGTDIGMYELLRSALRQRPEYIVVGEVRGEEAQTLFQAMATGHATYSTLHADSVKSAVYRLENRPIDVPRMMLRTLDAVAVQTQVRVGDRLVRRVKELTEITGIDNQTGDLLTNQVYTWHSNRDEFEFLGRSHVLDKLRRRRNMSVQEIEDEWSQRARVLDWMVDRGIRHIEDVGRVLSTYYGNPDKLMRRVEADLEEPDLAEETGAAEQGGDRA